MAGAGDLVKSAIPSAARLGATGVPSLPAHIRKTLKIGRAWTLGLPVIGRDGLLGLSDLARQFGKRLLRLAGLFRARDLANGETGGLMIPQSLAVLSELGPMPRDVAVTVCGHVTLLSRERDHDSAKRSAQGRDRSTAVNPGCASTRPADLPCTRLWPFCA